MKTTTTPDTQHAESVSPVEFLPELWPAIDNGLRLNLAGSSIIDYENAADSLQSGLDDLTIITEDFISMQYEKKENGMEPLDEETLRYATERLFKLAEMHRIFRDKFRSIAYKLKSEGEANVSRDN